MIVEDELDRGRGRMGGVELFQEFDEFARAMSPLDAGVDDAGHQIDAGQQALRPQSNVFVIARDGPMTHGLGRQVGRLVGERLDTRLLVIGDEGDSRCLRGRFPASGFRRLFQLFDLAIDGNDSAIFASNSGSRRSR